MEPQFNSIKLGKLEVVLNKNTFTSLVLLLVLAAIAHKLMPPSVESVFTMKISKNRDSITSLHQPRNVELYNTVKVDRINFTDRNKFRHPVLGDLGYENDFFADIDGTFYVKVAADYLFYAASDDGFSLSVDGHTLCEWAKDRPLTTDVCNVHLDTGLHRFSLSYFQGFGNAGLSLQYANVNDGKQYFVGENSKFIKFD